MFNHPAEIAAARLVFGSGLSIREASSESGIKRAAIHRAKTRIYRYLKITVGDLSRFSQRDISAMVGVMADRAEKLNLSLTPTGAEASSARST
jgi:hypothetical protein